jgi:hypothetical protein
LWAASHRREDGSVGIPEVRYAKTIDGVSIAYQIEMLGQSHRRYAGCGDGGRQHDSG